MKFLKNEDNWSVVLGLFIVVVICTLYLLQIPIANLNVKIKPWSDISELFNLVSHSILGLLSLAIGFWITAIFGCQISATRHKVTPIFSQIYLIVFDGGGHFDFKQ